MLNIKNVFSGCLLSLFLINSGFAATASDTLTQRLQNIHTMQASFTQSVKDKSANSLQFSEGKMSLVRPGKFRWQTEKKCDVFHRYR